MGVPAITYPADPIFQILHGATNVDVAVAVGLSPRMDEVVATWREGKRLWPNAADRYAVALGHHPAELWPSWIEDWK